MGLLLWVANLDWAAGEDVVAPTTSSVGKGKVDNVYLIDYKDLTV
mgnify:CR=1 FL=1